MLFRKKSLDLCVLCCTFAFNSLLIEHASGQTSYELLQAVSANDVAKVENLIATGLDVNKSIERGETLLIRAALCGHAEVTRILLDNDADLHASLSKGDTAFHIAVANNNKEVAEMLLAEGVGFDVKNKLGETPLWLAVEAGAEDTALWLLELGADPNVKSTFHPEMALVQAARRSKKILLEALLKYGADPNSIEGDGRNALHAVAMNGNADIAAILINAGCNVNAVNHRKFTPLHQASHQGRGDQAEVIKLLINAGADIYIKDKQGKTALDRAIKRLEKAKNKDNLLNDETRKVAISQAKAILNVLEPAYKKSAKQAKKKKISFTSTKPVMIQEGSEAVNDSVSTSSAPDVGGKSNMSLKIGLWVVGLLVVAGIGVFAMKRKR